MITKNDFDALTDDMQSIFNEVASTSIAEMKGNKIFSVTDTNRRTFDHLILHGISGIQEVTPGQDLPTLTTEQGDTITYTQRYFGGLVPVTKEMRKFDLYNQIESIIRSVSEDGFDKIDQSYADALLYGWATSYTDVYGKSIASVGPDAVCLFSTGHTNNLNSNTFSNVITSNPALSRAAINTARIQGMIHTDPNGIIRPVNLDTLVVAPSNEDLARRILESDLMSGTGNNDTNPLKGKVKNVIVWERLQTRSDATDTSAYWFMYDSSKVKETLKSLFAERPSLDPPDEVYTNKNWDYSIDFFYTIGFGYPAYIFGSNAAGS